VQLGEQTEFDDPGGIDGLLLGDVSVGCATKINGFEHLNVSDKTEFWN
jgi:hypothetical protein